MRVVALDIGNSKLAAAIVEDGQLSEVFLGEDETRPRALEAKAAEIHDWCIHRLRAFESRGGVDALAVSSVVPSVLQLWQHLWSGRNLTGEVPQVVVHAGLSLPFPIDIDRPETIGADRLCNVAGALALGLSRAIVVDLGTANTYDLLWDGRFAGGLIGPGFVMAHRTMSEGTAQLPTVPFARPKEILGHDTSSSLVSGSFHQAVGAVAHIVQVLWDRHADCPVVLSGGLAPLVGAELPFSVLYHPQLTLEGAAHVAEHVLGGSS